VATETRLFDGDGFKADTAMDWHFDLHNALLKEFGSADGSWHLTGIGEVTFTPAAWSSNRLRIVRSLDDDDSGSFTVSLLTDDQPEADEVRRWRAAVQDAMVVLGAAEQDFDWHAAIEHADGGFKVVRGSITTCSLSFRACHDSIRVIDRMAWPTVVVGKTRARTPGAAVAEARRILRMVCAMLAVESGFTMFREPRLGPPTDPFEQPDENRSISELRLSASFDNLLGTLLAPKDHPARDAMLMFYEGIVLQKDHPTMALVAFISAIERLAAPVDPPRCAECGHVPGVTAAFREAIQSVSDSGETLKMMMRFYGQYRSQTVHLGLLHGNESTFNRGSGDSLFFISEGDQFQRNVPFLTSIIARRLLVKSLGTEGESLLETEDNHHRAQKELLRRVLP